jgi:hypothetical protein
MYCCIDKDNDHIPGEGLLRVCKYVNNTNSNYVPYLSETLRLKHALVAYDCDTQDTGRPLREVT